MNKKEFASQIQASGKPFKRAVFVGVTVVGIWMLSAPVLDHFYNFSESKALAQVWNTVGVLLLFVVLLVLAYFSTKRGVPCRHCKKHLFGIPGQIAVATEYCGHCGERAFEG